MIIRQYNPGFEWGTESTPPDEKFYRPSEVRLLLGDCTKGKKELDWIPSIRFENLVKMMVEANLSAIQND